VSRLCIIFRGISPSLSDEHPIAKFTKKNKLPGSLMLWLSEICTACQDLQQG